MPHKLKSQPLCRYCAKRISKHPITVYLKSERGVHDRAYPGFSRFVYVDAPVKSKAECQRLTNMAILSVKWNRKEISTATGYERKPEHDYIASFSEWDGESYADEFFCNGDHAKRFAYVMARAGHQTQAHADACRAITKKETT